MYTILNYLISESDKDFIALEKELDLVAAEVDFDYKIYNKRNKVIVAIRLPEEKKPMFEQYVGKFMKRSYIGAYTCNKKDS